MASLNTRPRTQPGNQTLASPRPAMDAMRQGPANSAAPDLSLVRKSGSTPAAPGLTGAAPGTTPPTNQVPAAPTATVDTSRTDQLYKDQLAQSDKDRELMQQVGLNTIAGLQTRNASNAARMGLQAGGASYLSGQRSAAIQGVNAFNQGLQQWGNQRQGIMSGQAGILSGAANTNAGNTQQSGLATYGRQNQIDDTLAAAEAERQGKVTEANAGNILKALKNTAGIDVQAGRGATWALGSALYTAYSQAPAGSPEQAQAYQAFQNYANKVAQAKQDWQAAGGEKGTNRTFDGYLKLREKAGYFN